MSSVLTKSLLAPVLAFLKGARLAKLEDSLAVLRAAEARGAWEGREAQKVSSGFYQGLADSVEIETEGETQPFAGRNSDPVFCLQWGQAYTGPLPRVIVGKGRAAKAVPTDVVAAWVTLCNVAAELRKQLDAARPKPIVTAVGLSPKVTKTLTEMNLDIDLPTITPAKIVPKRVQSVDNDGKPMFRDGKPVMETIYVVEWANGIKLGQSRFHSGCEACGKPIPSGMYVPIEAMCRKSGLVGMWLGCDCARNIFGVKDKGITK